MRPYDIAVLLQNQHYQALLERLREIQPLIPRYDPKTDNIEELKHQSARYEMFETVMKILNPNGDFPQ